jgi:hypothetical protein
MVVSCHCNPRQANEYCLVRHCYLHIIENEIRISCQILSRFLEKSNIAIDLILLCVLSIHVIIQFQQCEMFVCFVPGYKVS